MPFLLSDLLLFLCLAGWATGMVIARRRNWKVWLDHWKRSLHGEQNSLANQRRRQRARDHVDLIARPMSAPPPIAVKHRHRSETPLCAKTDLRAAAKAVAIRSLRQGLLLA